MFINIRGKRCKHSNVQRSTNFSCRAASFGPVHQEVVKYKPSLLFSQNRPGIFFRIQLNVSIYIKIYHNRDMENKLLQLSSTALMTCAVM